MRALILSCLVVAATLAGCIADTDTQVPPPTDTVDDLLAGPALWSDPQNAPHPAYGWPTLSSPAEAGAPTHWEAIAAAALPDVVTGIAHHGQAEGVAAGAGIALFGSIAFVPGFGKESHVVDISDPSAPKAIGTVPTERAHRGAAIIAYPNGTLMAAVSTGVGFDVVNITDPTDPVIINITVSEQEGHKLGVVPGTPILYNAASWGGGPFGIGGNAEQAAMGVTEIYDLSDPYAPRLAKTFENGYSCHHIYFWNSPAEEKYRAICAGIEYTQIWDIADPLDPKVIVNVPVHHGVAGTPSASVPVVAFSHYAGLSQDGKTLLVGDEMGGGSIAPGCVAGAPTPAGHAATPLGAVWFYDVSVETEPRLKGWFSPGMVLEDPNPEGSCTAHHGRIIPTEGRDLLALAFYDAGVVVIDFSDPTAPVLVDQFDDNTDTWEVWYNQGYLFTGDLARGLDVFAFE